MEADQKNTGGKGVLFSVKGTFRVYLKKPFSWLVSPLLVE